MNSGPLSERMKAGSSLWANRVARVFPTSLAVMDLSTSMERHSLLCAHPRPASSSEPAAILRSVHHEIVAPYVVLVPGSPFCTSVLADAKAPPLALFCGYFESRFSPEAVHPLLVDLEALPP